MSDTSILHAPFWLLLIALLLTLTDVSQGMSQGLDPTMPSELIRSKLAPADKGVTPRVIQSTSSPVSQLRLQLKAIVVRNSNHGTAIISQVGSKDTVVKLRREKESQSESQVKFSGHGFIVKDFSNTSIVLQHVDTQQQLTVK